MNKQVIQEGVAQKPKKRFRWVKRIFLLFFLMIIAAGIAGGALFMYYIKDAPKLKIAKLDDSLPSRLLDINGKPFYEVGEKKRKKATADEIPNQLKQAIISIEDKRFEKHPGVDPIRIVGAAVANLTSQAQQGGSTLTQQLIKLSYYSTKDEDKTYKRKAQEAWLAIRLEKVKNKNEILAFYINKVYMANGLYGMETAAQSYYNKRLKDLSLAQTALLAGMPQAPVDYDPITHPDNATKRRNLVLREMYKDKKISTSAYQAAIAEPVTKDLQKIVERSQEAKMVDNYVKQVLEEAQKKTTRNVYTDGLDIYTNIDIDAQNYLYQLVNSNEQIAFPDDEFQTAITIMDVTNGHVLAQVGGRKIAEDTQLGKNRAVSSERDFGSTVKPITDYAPAIEYLNFSTGRILNDTPYTYPGTTKSVYNYDNRYLGSITLREALVDSRNIPALKTLNEVGLDKAGHFLKGLGISYPEGMVQAHGISGQLTSLKMAGAYAAIANGGTYYKPAYINKIVYPDKTEEVFNEAGKVAMKPSTAYLITDVLKDVLARGTGTQANISGIFHAGKTGTSNYDQDSKSKVIGDQYNGVPDISFVGYSPKIVIAIWTGYDNYFHAIDYNSQNIAMLLYRSLMQYFSQNQTPIDWEMPANVVQIGGELYIKNHTSNQYSRDSQQNYYSEDGYTNNSYNNYVPPSSSQANIESQEPPASSETPTNSQEPEQVEPPPEENKPVEPTPPPEKNNE